MPVSVQVALLVVAAYLVGAIPFGFVVGKLKGIDIRTAGSGNIGATNVGRLLGKRWFWLVFALDALKGTAPMLAGLWVTSGLPEGPGKYAAWLAAGMAALLGHVFPVYLGFKGGKGVATALGMMLGVWPFYTLAAIPTVAMFLGVFAVSRIISLGSIAATLTFPVGLLVVNWAMGWELLGHQWPLLVFACGVSALVMFRHRGNISRLRAGTEPKFGEKAKSV